VEPFCGAGHLLFSKESSQVEVLNDIDSHLIGFFELLKDDTKRSKLIQTLDNMLYSRRLWQEIRSRWKAGNIPQDEIERASWWFYLNRTTFSGDQKRGGFAIPSTTSRNPVQSFRNAVDSLKAIAERLRNVCIENLDYQECIRRYDSKDTLFYCDPPYLNTEHYYGNTFTQDNHRTLFELLHGIKGHVMVTHYQNSLYDDLYKGWHRYEYQSFKGSYKSEGEEKPVTVECLWTNFESKQRGLFDAME
ncbi:MAG TPA: DNA adenine methylase, partial [Candidatus Brocadiales bacterium]|nr:DNA adenine methylase [Candidatus Brocadiales bacterium]